MNSKLKTFFMVIGIISTIALIIIIIVIFGVYNIIKNMTGSYTTAPINTDGVNTEEVYDHPALSEDQEQTLDKLGIDVSTLPTSITPEQQACAVEKLGQDRVLEIVGGASPSAIELVKAGSCFK
ncbi:hypothetical protein KKG22_01955 [Patescibacteria group bacterium]|nr:hypothetical protein [Patescibacteria group bacterium]MBU1721881.1 hypothetical protein [Patescibacteria group bacterium]MBU1901339.1 hypothetical protein [Patescibacteria group bacterium]